MIIGFIAVCAKKINKQQTKTENPLMWKEKKTQLVFFFSIPGRVLSVSCFNFEVQSRTVLPKFHISLNHLEVSF